MQITVNGAEREVADGISVGELLTSLELKSEGVAVAQNRDVVPRAEHAARLVQPNDRIEIVRAVQGG